ncbi:cation diffusion facilitator family transporter [Lacipirellula parvula]|uniref:Cobalt-zinc-cadmium resistance protein n=1 Tax=Lacipirellula parvula TaxID=2650471 RepID=A0A5K7X8U5_9BACT|nr:cation diffusion facilitator family transporter [Lacipirellula parvula]BBO32302.1 cobalt-zinc-cadmium resistance protein [Lacipirellula parvula]
MASLEQGIKAAQTGLLVNCLLVIVKLVSGIVGHSYALVADAIESSTDIFSSLIVWGGLRVASRPADDDHPYGHGKAESLAAAIVALMLLGAAVSIAIVAVREIITPHHAPMPFTLAVVAGVVIIKESLFRTVFKVGDSIGSTSVKTDAWHHRSDAITSAAAFIGIALAIWGGPGWEPADDWAALVASVIIAANGLRFMTTAASELMDRSPDDSVISTVDAAARSVAGVLATEKVRARKFGVAYLVDLHVQADRNLALDAAHVVSGKVKTAIREALPAAQEVLVHMEPF